MDQIYVFGALLVCVILTESPRRPQSIGLIRPIHNNAMDGLVLSHTSMSHSIDLMLTS